MSAGESVYHDAQASGYDLQSTDEELVVTIRKTFDQETRSADWVGRIVLDYNKPYQRVVVDMSKCMIVSSTLYAGLIRMAQHYNPSMNDDKVRLRQISTLVDRTLQMLRVRDLFIVESVREAIQ